MTDITLYYKGSRQNLEQSELLKGMGCQTSAGGEKESGCLLEHAEGRTTIYIEGETFEKPGDQIKRLARNLRLQAASPFYADKDGDPQTFTDRAVAEAGKSYPNDVAFYKMYLAADGKSNIAFLLGAKQYTALMEYTEAAAGLKLEAADLAYVETKPQEGDAPAITRAVNLPTNGMIGLTPSDSLQELTKYLDEPVKSKPAEPAYEEQILTTLKGWGTRLKEAQKTTSEASQSEPLLFGKKLNELTVDEASGFLPAGLPKESPAPTTQDGTLPSWMELPAPEKIDFDAGVPEAPTVTGSSEDVTPVADESALTPPQAGSDGSIVNWQNGVLLLLAGALGGGLFLERRRRRELERQLTGLSAQMQDMDSRLQAAESIAESARSDAELAAQAAERAVEIRDQLEHAEARFIGLVRKMLRVMGRRAGAHEQNVRRLVDQGWRQGNNLIAELEGIFDDNVERLGNNVVIHEETMTRKVAEAQASVNALLAQLDAAKADIDERKTAALAEARAASETVRRETSRKYSVLVDDIDRLADQINGIKGSLDGLSAQVARGVDDATAGHDRMFEVLRRLSGELETQRQAVSRVFGDVTTLLDLDERTNKRLSDHTSSLVEFADQRHVELEAVMQRVAEMTTAIKEQTGYLERVVREHAPHIVLPAIHDVPNLDPLRRISEGLLDEVSVHAVNGEIVDPRHLLGVPARPATPPIFPFPEEPLRADPPPLPDEVNVRAEDGESIDSRQLLTDPVKPATPLIPIPEAPLRADPSPLPQDPFGEVLVPRGGIDPGAAAAAGSEDVPTPIFTASRPTDDFHIIKMFYETYFGAELSTYEGISSVFYDENSAARFSKSGLDRLAKAAAKRLGLPESKAPLLVEAMTEMRESEMKVARYQGIALIELYKSTLYFAESATRNDERIKKLVRDCLQKSAQTGSVVWEKIESAKEFYTDQLTQEKALSDHLQNERPRNMDELRRMLGIDGYGSGRDQLTDIDHALSKAENGSWYQDLRRVIHQAHSSVESQRGQRWVDPSEVTLDIVDSVLRQRESRYLDTMDVTDFIKPAIERGSQVPENVGKYFSSLSIEGGQADANALKKVIREDGRYLGLIPLLDKAIYEIGLQANGKALTSEEKGRIVVRVLQEIVETPGLTRETCFAVIEERVSTEVGQKSAGVQSEAERARAKADAERLRAELEVRKKRDKI